MTEPPPGERVPASPSPRLIVPALGIAQILAWGSSYYLPAVFAGPIARDTGWPLAWIVGGLSIGLVIAGLVAPKVGGWIQRRGGRPALAISSLLFALGLGLMALAPNLAVFLAAWLIMGLAMGAGLYDAAFSTLGLIYGARAHRLIAALTLFGGFASTLCWPLSAAFVSALGWRGACAAYALIHLSICLPLYWFGLPRAGGGGSASPAEPAAAASGVRPSSDLLLLLAGTIMLGAVIAAVVSVHLLTILQSRGLGLAAAVSLGALVGPSQVGARFIEMLIGCYHHPKWTLAASIGLVAGGLCGLYLGFPVLALPLMLYGAGLGLESIGRASLPLALFGPENYPAIMGKLARPSLIAQAAGPSIAALAMEKFGPSRTLLGIVVAALVDAILVAALLIRLNRRGET